MLHFCLKPVHKFFKIVEERANQTRKPVNFLCFFAFLTQLVEYLHGKQKVTGSSPVKGYFSILVSK